MNILIWTPAAGIRLARTTALGFLILLSLLTARGSAGESKLPGFRPQEIEARLGVGYAVLLEDVNGDGKLDIVVVDSDRLRWYENPTWEAREFLAGQTTADNVSAAPLDIDGNGRLDFALAAHWKPADTLGSGTLQWISRGKEDEWNVHAIGLEPTAHRIRFADFDGDKRPELIVVPLFGRGSSAAKNWTEAPLRILSYKIPADPVIGPWEPEVISEELHVAHNFWPADVDGDGGLDMLVASHEGVSLLKRSPEGKWSHELLHKGSRTDAKNTGASEIKLGRWADGERYIATIEPWHGNQVVVYRQDPPEVMRPRRWNREVLDDELQWGHAVWCANLDDDKDEELILGVRDTKDQAGGVLCGVRIFDPPSAAGDKWLRTLLDPGGVAVEDLAAADLNGDGRTDIVAVGRATKNVKIYWNEAP